MRTNPYQRWVGLQGDGLEVVARGTVDAGSQANVIDAALWAAHERSLGPLKASKTLLRVADGKASRCLGRWEGMIRMDEVQRRTSFEVFDSGGAFEVLLGKPWLTETKAVQSFEDDCLRLPGIEKPLRNGFPLLEPEAEMAPTGSEEVKVERVNDDEDDQAVEEEEEEPREVGDEQEVEVMEPGVESADERTEVGEGEEDQWVPAPRRSTRLEAKRAKRSGQGLVKRSNVFWIGETSVARLEEMVGMSRDREDRVEIQGVPEPEKRLEEAVGRAERALERRSKAERKAARILAKEQARAELRDMLQIQADHSAHLPITPSPRRQNPFEPGRVASILGKVEIGKQLSPEERAQVKALVSEFADIFALDLTEVLPVKTHSHRLDIQAGARFRKRVAQKPLSQAQKAWLYPTLDLMEAAHIIKRVPNTFPAAVSPSNVVPKPGGANEPSLEYLQMLANRACEQAGLPVRYPLAQESPPAPAPKEAKFRLVHNFAEVNELTKIPAFPMGDLAAKQRAVAGYRFVNTIDFASGFNALPMEEESIKYTGFYVEGKGHYVYLRMPFGLTGAPTSFCEMLADALHDLLGGGMEIWMDDVGMGFNSVEDGLARTRRLFERCSEKGLSLAPAKTKLFLGEVVFAGAKVSMRGIQPDRRKVQAILEWQEPKSVLELMGFLGLTGAFRSKIRDYARIARPLSDLTRNVKVERRGDGKSRKGEYKRVLQNTAVELNEEGRRAFAELKVVLTTDPVLRAPTYDGRPFVITTDGSKYGFGAMLTQRWEEMDSKGKKKVVSYPIAFASKRTSRTEENYAPFLLEFAALKFGFDSFEPIVMGQEIEVETDCKALADLLGNKKLGSTHERWRESIIAHRIVAVRHRPGIENPVCDALSRQWQYRADEEGGEGREESVDPDWEAYKGLVADVHLLVEDTGSGKVLERFTGDEYFGEITQYLVLGTVYGDDMTPSNVERAQRRAAHRAVGFEVADGKLWRVAGKGSHRAPRVECIPKREGLALALATHEATGHFGRDLTILTLQERYFWPNLRSDVITAITTCPRCRNFGPKLMSALLAPITRARPFDLLCGDYLSLPMGTGGYKTVLLLVDVYSRFTFGFMTRNAGTGSFTVECLEKLGDTIMTPASFMSDNGSHFDCKEVTDWAKHNQVTLIHSPAYTPSVNGLVEDANKILLGRLRTLCAQDIGEARGDPNRPPTPPPRSWPKFLQTAIRQMNDRVLPSLGYTPRELLTGVLTADRRHETGASIRQQYTPTSPETNPIDVNLALAYALRSDGAERALTHARERKRRSDLKAKLITAEAGDLVQRYDPRWDTTHSTERKLAPRWSEPLRVRERKNSSYILESLDGELVSSGTHARHLRKFIPRPGSPLADHIAGAGAMPEIATREEVPVEP